MDCRKQKNRHTISQNLDKSLSGGNSLKERKCKKCGKIFTSHRLANYCSECISKDHRRRVKKYYTEHTKIKQKVKWRERLGLIQASIKTNEEWSVGFNPNLTTEVCAYCKERHEEERRYFHPFMKEIWVYGLDLEQIERLIDEIIPEVKKGKGRKELLEQRGLDIKGIIIEELKE